MYFANAIGQFMLMNYFLKIDYWKYGYNVITSVLTGRDWSANTLFFPRIVYCDFAIRYLGDSNLNYTVNFKFDVEFYKDFVWLLLGSMYVTY